MLRLVTGKTDVFVVDHGISPGADCPVSASVFQSGMLCFHAELKAPYRGLHHQASAAYLDQLLCENEVMLQMSGKAVAGALTDLFALSISLCICVTPDSESCKDAGANADADEVEWLPEKDRKSAHFLAPRVIRARDYVLHLLLLLCGPDACATLLPAPEDWTPIEAPLQPRSQCPTRDEMGGAAAAAAAAPATAPADAARLRERAAPRSGSAMTGPQLQTGCQVSGWSAQLQNLLDKEQEQACRRIVYLWECNRENVMPLTEEALGRHSRGDSGTAPHLWTRL